MNRAELLELIQYGENSGVEFKRDDVHPQRLAGEIAALLNLEGGHILLGIEDDGTVTGLARSADEAEEWVMQVARDHLLPPITPYWEVHVLWSQERVGIISLPANAPDKPYKAKRGSSWVTKVRVGSTTRDASREEEERLYQQAGRLQYGLKPIPGATIDDLDRRRLRDYFTRVLSGDAPEDRDAEQWEVLLRNLDLAVISAGVTAPTVDGMLLFGMRPGRFLPQSGVRAISYSGVEPDYAARADEQLKGAMLPLHGSDGSLIESGLVEQVWDFFRRNAAPVASLDDGRRVDSWEYPEDAVREIVINALVHRDYSIAGTDVSLSMFSDRLEVQSPGRLPNTVTLEGMRSGLRYARNQTLVNVMRDYGYVEARGMGIRNKVIPAMRAHNGSEPELVEGEYHFRVCLRK